MRISVECGGYAEAAAACRTANHVAALLTESLARKLSAYAGMAGDDATSEEFASSYDAGAREALAALTDLTHAHIGLSRLIDASAARHAAADASAAALPTNAYVGASLDEDSFARVSPGDPPSSLGHQERALGRVDAWILDQVEGFIWPGADADLLRDAAATWRRTSESVADLTDHHHIVADLLARQRSPEIPLALGAIDELREMAHDTADQLASMATACEDYAAAVEDIRERTRALLAEIGKMVVEEVTITVIVAGITGGLGGTAKAAAALARIRAQAPRFHALLTTLRATVATTTTRLRAARTQLERTRHRLEKFVNAQVRDERGAMTHPLDWGASRPPGWLKGHEVPPGHTLDRHVGKSLDELAERARTTGKPASSFIDGDAAEQLVDKVLTSRKADISAWIRTASDEKLVLDLPMRQPTGHSVLPDGSMVERTAVRVVLIPRPDLAEGWQVLTAFPT